MSDKKKKWQVNDEEEYVGNFFGWDVSIAGAVVLIIFCLIIAFRWFSLPPEQRTLAPPTATEEQVSDSIQ